MARYILIDSNSGYIFGDTAHFAAGHEFDGIADAARLLDASIGVNGRSYVEQDRNPGAGANGYDVYRADINGSEAVTVVHDGQDPETIRDVIESCDYVGFVECAR